MLSKALAWFKARWTWSRGLCPLCKRDFTHRSTAWTGNCDVCHGHTDDLTIWTRFRKHSPEPGPVVAVSEVPVMITRKADDATIVRED